jgi:hypothetical protein
MSTFDQAKNPAKLSRHLAHFCHWLNSQTGSNLMPKNASPCDKKMAAEYLPPLADQIDFVNRQDGL